MIKQTLSSVRSDLRDQLIVMLILAIAIALRWTVVYGG